MAELHGRFMAVPLDYKEHLTWLATARVRLLLSELIQDRDYVEKVQQENLSFLRTDRAFEKCLEIAHKKWRWVHIKLA